MNDLPCGSCKHFDPLKGSRRRPNTGYGRCAIKSTYPLQDSPGQTPPAGVKRSVKTFFEIVRATEVVPHCIQVRNVK